MSELEIFMLIYFSIGLFVCIFWSLKTADIFLWPLLLFMLLWWRAKEIIHGDIDV